MSDDKFMNCKNGENSLNCRQVNLHEGLAPILEQKCAELRRGTAFLNQAKINVDMDMVGRHQPKYKLEYRPSRNGIFVQKTIKCRYIYMVTL